MKIVTVELRIDLASTPFSLDHTLNCGQVFRWVKEGEWWLGVVEGVALKISQSGGGITVRSSSNDLEEKFISRYLRLDDDLPEILSKINRDRVMDKAIRSLKGLRLIRQDPWECTASFICATYANIEARIKPMVSKLCQELGRKVKFEGKVFYTFPEPKAIAGADTHALKGCGLGYRAGLLRETAKHVLSGDLVFQDLFKLDYETARQSLLARSSGRKLLTGVGPKVADCILLFALDKLEAFPIDTRIRQAIINSYSYLFDTVSIGRMKRGTSIGMKEYADISRTMRSYFGEYAGYAQEYLYHYVRSLGLGPSA